MDATEWDWWCEDDGDDDLADAMIASDALVAWLEEQRQTRELED